MANIQNTITLIFFILLPFSFYLLTYDNMYLFSFPFPINKKHQNKKRQTTTQNKKLFDLLLKLTLIYKDKSKNKHFILFLAAYIF